MISRGHHHAGMYPLTEVSLYLRLLFGLIKFLFRPEICHSKIIPIERENNYK